MKTARCSISSCDPRAAVAPLLPTCASLPRRCHLHLLGMQRLQLCFTPALAPRTSKRCRPLGKSNLWLGAAISAKLSSSCSFKLMQLPKPRSFERVVGAFAFRSGHGLPHSLLWRCWWHLASGAEDARPASSTLAIPSSLSIIPPPPFTKQARLALHDFGIRVA